MKTLLVLLSLMIAVPFADAGTLSNLELYKRCYGQLTGQAVKPSDAVTKQVASGQLNAIAACNALLNRAVLTGSGGTTPTDASDLPARRVLNHMHAIHSSWFQNKDFTTYHSPDNSARTMDLYDSSTPGLYVTRALFQATPSYKKVVMGNDLLLPIRTDMSPSVGPRTGMPLGGTNKLNLFFTSAYTFAAKGELLGIQTTAPKTLNYFCDGGVYYSAGPEGSVNWHKSWGGGLLGNNVYLLLNVKAIFQQDTDGGVKMPRRYGKAVYHDFLCRNLPAVRPSDAEPFVRPTSTIAFRQSSNCVSCHSSMDRTSSVIRGITQPQFDCFRNDAKPQGWYSGDSHFFASPFLGPESEWPAQPDRDYWKRPASGTLYFRNYNGELVSNDVNGIESLGQAIQAQDDYYICAAKRYYEYFTGIKVEIGDLGDELAPKLSEADVKHRATVIDLGKKLRTHDNLRTLINDIFNLPNYKDSAFGLK